MGNTRIVYKPLFCGEELLSYDVEYAGDYFPYGKIIREYVKGKKEKYLTTHHERDEETGLDYRGARFYDADVGRFLSLDPLATELPAWSSYNYVVGNPTAFVDPDGKWPFPTFKSAVYLANKTRSFFKSVGEGLLVTVGAITQAPDHHVAANAERLGNHKRAAELREGANDAIATLTFEALTGYGAGKVIRGATALLPRAAANSKSIALGLKEGLESFGKSKGASIVDDWADNGLISGKQLNFEGAFHEATSSVIGSGGKIHFNLDGFDIGKALGNRGKGLYDDGVGYTDWEFGQILDNPELLKNTVFYDKTGKVDISQLISEVKN